MKVNVNQVSVQIKKKQILSDISLEMEPGVYAVIGENGAGKTTFFRCILGLQDYQGSIEMDTKAFGYLPQRFETLKGLSVYESMEYFCCLKKLPKESWKDDIKKVLATVNLWEERQKKLAKLSGGMYQRVGVAQAILGESKLLIMDEPTVGLDPRERQNFKHVISQISREDTEKIVLISSHETKELDEICQKVIFLHRGKVRAVDSIQNLYEKYETQNLEQIFFRLTE